jgi:hypothetical protein
LQPLLFDSYFSMVIFGTLWPIWMVKTIFTSPSEARSQ